MHRVCAAWDFSLGWNGTFLFCLGSEWGVGGGGRAINEVLRVALLLAGGFKIHPVRVSIF